MIKTIELYFMLFVIYSIIGWFIEVILKFFEFKKFINRGFLVGPYLPIYGFGTLLITLLLHNYYDNTIVLFIFSIVICSILEYLTSYLMEKIFKARWWDYSERKFNINGRICLETMIPFGIAGVLAVKIINPHFFDIYKTLTPQFLNLFCITFVIILFIDFIFSTKIILSIKSLNIFKGKDNTEQISKIVLNKIKNLDWGQKRLLQAFPNVKTISTKIKATKEKASRAIKNGKNKIKNKIKRRTNGNNKDI